MACRHNNWLYRSGLDPLSATNLCYGKNISYTELYLDCNEFDETGKNFARLYGETIKLHETTNDKDFLKNALEEK